MHGNNNVAHSRVVTGTDKATDNSGDIIVDDMTTGIIAHRVNDVVTTFNVATTSFAQWVISAETLHYDLDTFPLNLAEHWHC